MNKIFFIGAICISFISCVITYMIVLGGNKNKSTKELLTESEEQMNIIKRYK